MDLQPATLTTTEEHPHGDPNLLRPIMDEVVRQLEEKSGRGGKFAEHFHPWTRDG